MGGEYVDDVPVRLVAGPTEGPESRWPGKAAKCGRHNLMEHDSAPSAIGNSQFAKR